MGSVHNKFIEPMLAIFDKPPGASAGRFFEFLTEDLGSFDDATLEAAVKLIRRTRRFNSFPNVGDCVSACRKVVEDAVPPARPRVSAPKDLFKSLRDEAAYRRACAACDCELGRQADRDLWLPALVDFVMANDRFPDHRERPGLIGSARRAADGIRAVQDVALASGDGNGLAPMLSKLRKTMLERYSKDTFGSVQVYVPAGYGMRRREGCDVISTEAQPSALDRLATQRDQPIAPLSERAKARAGVEIVESEREVG